jgi:hypothetical protein
MELGVIALGTFLVMGGSGSNIRVEPEPENRITSYILGILWYCSPGAKLKRRPRYFSLRSDPHCMSLEKMGHVLCS